MKLKYCSQQLYATGVFLVITLLSANSWAQTVTGSNTDASESLAMSLTQIFFAAMVLVLSIVIIGLGLLILELSRQLANKNSSVSKSKITLLVIIGLGLLSFTSYAQAIDATATDTPLSIGGISGIPLYVFVAAIIVEVFVIFFMMSMIRNLNKALYSSNTPLAKEKTVINWWVDLDKKIFTKAVPVEKEADVLLDHDYDGIRELDNALPPWWKYGFYITIVVAFVYLFLFHVTGTGKNPTEEYAAQMEEGRLQKEKFDALNKDKVDENNVPMADAQGVAAGKEIFMQNCTPCHGKFGEGGAGPNLTDDYWLHKGSLNDIFKSIKNGYIDKGMQSWIIKFNEKEISEIASYITTLHGTHPAGAREPQGELFKVDSTISKIDSTKLATTN